MPTHNYEPLIWMAEHGRPIGHSPSNGEDGALPYLLDYEGPEGLDKWKVGYEDKEGRPVERLLRGTLAECMRAAECHDKARYERRT